MQIKSVNDRTYLYNFDLNINNTVNLKLTNLRINAKSPINTPNDPTQLHRRAHRNENSYNRHTTRRQLIAPSRFSPECPVYNSKRHTPHTYPTRNTKSTHPTTTTLTSPECKVNENNNKNTGSPKTNSKHWHLSNVLCLGEVDFPLQHQFPTLSFRRVYFRPCLFVRVLLVLSWKRGRLVGGENLADEAARCVCVFRVYQVLHGGYF